jgi:hypothetical protein
LLSSGNPNISLKALIPQYIMAQFYPLKIEVIAELIAPQ